MLPHAEPGASALGPGGPYGWARAGLDRLSGFQSGRMAWAAHLLDREGRVRLDAAAVAP
ncbi:MAG: hypothetical protein HY784_00745 [Chloroflexi bacterium]|nr:hypothetical protein [Chloroflexota bacterium]